MGKGELTFGDKIVPLLIKLPHMIGYYNIYDDGKKGMNFRCQMIKY